MSSRPGMKARLIAVVAAVLASWLPSEASAVELAGTTLRVATWGGSWRDSIDKHISGKLAAQGVKVEYVLGNPEDNLAKLIAARRQGQVPFDVMEGSPELFNAMVSAGLLEKINYDHLPNAKGLPVWAREAYQVVGLLTEDGIAYNVEKFRQAGLEPPQRYSDLQNPKLSGHVAFPDTSHVQHWNAVVGLAYEAGGNEGSMAGAVRLVNALKPAYFYTASTELATRFGSGDIWAAPWHAGWVVRLKRTGVPVAMAYTRFGDKKGAVWAVPQYIVKGTRNLAAAEAFINEYLSVEVQYEHGKTTGCVPVSSAARARMREDAESREALFLSDAELGQAYRISWSRLDPRQWRETWTREVRR